MNADGGGQAALTTGTWPTWSPDGTKIAFMRGVDIYVMNADGSGQSPVLAGFTPTWSPDGGSIAFMAGDSIYRAPSGGGPRTPIKETDCPPPPFGTCFTYSEPAWSPDGRWIAAEMWEWIDDEGELLLGEHDLIRVSADGSGLIGSIGPDGASPDWSPSGHRIAYWRSSGQGFAIWTMNPNGTAQSQLTFDATHEFYPAWSPDGSKVLYAKGPPGGPNQIYVVDAAGANQVQLTSGNDTLPDWQPIPINAYPRPKGASPLRISLVTAYDQCAAPNRTHGPPLAFGSCNPPAKESQHLTVGTGDSNARPARNEGYLRLRTISGNPSTPADEADIAITVFSDDVFNVDLTDYTGELRAELALRITDKDNTPHPGGPGAGTTQDLTFDVDATCTAVVDPQEGSSCQTTTSADALIPGAIKEGRRSVWQLGQVVVYDGGADGDTATADNAVFARQGVFIP